MRDIKQQSATATTDPGKYRLGDRRRAALDEEVAIVRLVETAAVPDGVTDSGEKLHVAPEGKPEQAKLTAALKPLIGVTEMMVVVFAPEPTAAESGEAPIEKSLGRLIVKVALAIALVLYPEAIAIASIVSVEDTVSGPLYCFEAVEGAVPSVV